MAKNRSMTADRIRELARTGAEVTLKRLRAEIVAIERAFPELRLPQHRRALRRSINKEATRSHADDVGRCWPGNFGQVETLLGRTPQGARKNQMTTKITKVQVLRDIRGFVVPGS